MRIRILHTFFYPDKSSVSQILADLAFYLAEEGHQVDVIASRGSYEGGKKLPKAETAQGVSIRRIWSPSLGKKSILTRLADLCCYSVGSFVKAMFSPRADRVVVLTNPPMYALVGTLLKLLRREPYVYVLMDLYPDFAIRGSPSQQRTFNTIRQADHKKLTFRHAERIVVLGTCMARRVEGYGIPREKIVIIRNWADGNAIRPLPPHANPLRAKFGLDDKFVVMYSGNMGVGHRFDDILQAALDLRDRKDISFFFAGNGVRRGEIEAFRDEHSLRNITVCEYFAREMLGESLPLGDAHFVSLREGYEGLIVPSKLYGIMAAGRPTIYQGDPGGEIARVLLDRGGGKVIAEGDVEGLRELITYWADHPQEACSEGARAREIFDEAYAQEIGMRAYQEVLEGTPA